MRIRNLITSLLLIVMVVMTGNSPAHATPFASPAAMLTSYYNDISLRQYQTAYAFWTNSPQTYDNFVTGYATTDHVTPYLGDYQQTGFNIGLVPSVLVGYHIDGSIVAYQGCFSVDYTSMGWYILGANFQLFTNQLPNNDTISAYLSIDCQAANLPPPTLTPTPIANPPTMLDPVTQMLTNYYVLINRQDYTNAYAMWLHPLPGPKPNGAPAQDYRLPFDQFVSGYGTTKFADVYPGTFNATGAFAGHGYVMGELPVLLVGEHTDGTYIGFLGCYVIGGMQGIPLGIISGAFQQISDGVDVPNVKATLPVLKTIRDSMQPNLKF